MVHEPRIAARWAVIHALKNCKWDVAAAAKQTRKSAAFVRRWMNHYKAHGTVTDKPRSGRPQKISAAVRAAAVTVVSEQQSVPVATAILKSQGILDADVHVKTALRAVRQDMECKTVEQRPILSAASRSKRKSFCQQIHNTDHMIAIDSSYFTLGTVQPRRRYWHLKGTRPIAGRPNKSQQLHVYGGITAHGKTELVYVTGTTGHHDYRYQSGKSKGQKMSGMGSQEFQDIMRNKLVPQAQQVFAAAGVSSSSDIMWLMDNAPAHTAKASKAFLSSNGINTCKSWPPNSPDLNPIENVWAVMKQQVYSRHYNTLAELKAAVEKAWQGLPLSYLKTLMASFSSRKAKCLLAGGGYAGY